MLAEPTSELCNQRASMTTSKPAGISMMCNMLQGREVGSDYDVTGSLRKRYLEMYSEIRVAVILYCVSLLVRQCVVTRPNILLNIA